MKFESQFAETSLGPGGIGGPICAFGRAQRLQKRCQWAESCNRDLGGEHHLERNGIRALTLAVIVPPVPWLPVTFLVRADELCIGQHVALHCSLDLRFRRAS
jgi:hypothetical protein